MLRWLQVLPRDPALWKRTWNRHGSCIRDERGRQPTIWRGFHFGIVQCTMYTLQVGCITANMCVQTFISSLHTELFVIVFVCLAQLRRSHQVTLRIGNCHIRAKLGGKTPFLHLFLERIPNWGDFLLQTFAWYPEAGVVWVCHTRQTVWAKWFRTWKVYSGE